jgi:lipopolysaccharide/colanic/teichoic acid biosynthesis glycosyltransferase
MFFSKFDDIVETGISAKTESDKPTTSRIFNFTSYFTVERAGLSKSAKRVLDLFVALVAILLLWPILLLVNRGGALSACVDSYLGDDMRSRILDF